MVASGQSLMQVRYLAAGSGGGSTPAALRALHGCEALLDGHGNLAASLPPQPRTHGSLRPCAGPRKASNWRVSLAWHEFCTDGRA